MSEESRLAQLARWKVRLEHLPLLQLPLDYPRPSIDKVVEAQQSRALDQRAAKALVRLSLFEEDEDEDDSQGSSSGLQRPSPFHLLLAVYVVLLHRYTGDIDLVIATSSFSAGDPLLIRVRLEGADSFWSLGCARFSS